MGKSKTRDVIIAVAIVAAFVAFLFAWWLYGLKREEKRLNLIFSCQHYYELIVLCNDEILDEETINVDGNEYRVVTMRPAKSSLFVTEDTPKLVFDKNGMCIDRTSGVFYDPVFKSTWLSRKTLPQETMGAGSIRVD